MRLLNKNLYTHKKLSEDSWEVVMADEAHPVFKAHFEGNPLLPAFLQIDIMGEILGKKLLSIDRSKFKQPILPNDKILYKILKVVDNSYKIEILKDDISTTEFKVSYQ
jgi:3-hydroxymyristoyl/3-hydroxydecanoyl-(acyl carrier protein) dehydratase